LKPFGHVRAGVPRARVFDRVLDEPETGQTNPTERMIVAAMWKDALMFRTSSSC
jgi:hypothetical protein